MQPIAALDREALLAKNLLFTSLSPGERRELLTLATVEQFDRDQEIFNKGDPGNGLYLILEGRVGIKTSSVRGQEIILNILERGEVFGEIALLDGKERTAGAIAMEPTELLFIGRPHFIRFLEKRPKLCLYLMRILCARLRWTSDIIEDSIFLDIRSRLAKRLLTLASIYGVDNEEGVTIKLRLAQDKLGDMLGVTRESINKEMVAWQAENVIRYSRSYITIRDLKVLEQLADLPT